MRISDWSSDVCSSDLAKLSASVSVYLEAQLAAGADALMVFDTWGGVLAPADYVRFSLEPMAKIVVHLKRVAPSVPVILFTKNGGQHLEVMAETGCAAQSGSASCRERVCQYV